MKARKETKKLNNIKNLVNAPSPTLSHSQKRRRGLNHCNKIFPPYETTTGSPKNKGPGDGQIKTEGSHLDPEFIDVLRKWK